MSLSSEETVKAKQSFEKFAKAVISPRALVRKLKTAPPGEKPADKTVRLEQLEAAIRKLAEAEVCEECRRMGTSQAVLETAEKKGFDTGIRALHPLIPGKKIPVYVANFILMKYGTGAIFGCPAHDQRDLDFVNKYGLGNIPVVAPEGVDPAGALLATLLDDFLDGKREFDVLFAPTARKSLAGFSPTRNHILLNELDNVRNRVSVLTHGKDGWQREPLPGMPEFGTVGASAVDAEDSDAYFMTVTDYLTPTSLYVGEIGKGAPEKLKSLPAFFDKSGLEVAQREATSDDGTKVPYFIVSRKDLALDGDNPTLLYGYGGFEVPMVPGYSAGVGAAWLEKGGVYVVANIRGGGEFGPKWHQAALKANRNKAFEDFAAVAKDLIARKVTKPANVGAK